MKKSFHNNTIHLNSEALKTISYDEDTHILEATFSNNRTYQYIKMPKRVWKDFLKTITAGKSAGAFINKRIKPFYKYVEIS